MTMKLVRNKTLGAMANLVAVALLFVPVFRLGQVAYRLLSQGPSAALGEMERGTRGLSENRLLAPWSEVVLEFGFVMLLYAVLGLAFLWIGKKVALDAEVSTRETTRHSV